MHLEDTKLKIGHTDLVIPGGMTSQLEVLDVMVNKSNHNLRE